MRHTTTQILQTSFTPFLCFYGVWVYIFKIGTLSDDLNIFSRCRHFNGRLALHLVVNFSHGKSIFAIDILTALKFLKRT